MCGIAGIISKTEVEPKAVETVRKMADAMVHRGPDGYGEHLDSRVVFAMRRLRIIDLAHGWQPLYNEQRNHVLICNGMIYNYVELRERCLSKGHYFRTGSDSEVILHLYEEYGLDCVQHLRGMFAFALWDIQKHRLMLARDRMGEKPLYLYERQGRLIFASELKALLTSREVAFELDPVAVDQYFHYAYVPEPRTPIKGVRKLSAGHFLTVEIDSWRVEERSYWRLEESPPLDGEPDKLIRAEFDTISRLVVRSNVPVGVALSSGLDSSAIAALAVRHYPGSMHAFSVGYPGQPPNDERAGAKALAEHLRMPFHDVEITPSDMVAFFPKLNYWRDDPIADISGYGYYSVMKLAREHGVPVMLQGQGGDELFWGYQPFLRQAVQLTMIKPQVHENVWTMLRAVLASQLIKPTGLRSFLSAVKHMFGLNEGWAFFKDFRKGIHPNRMVFYDLEPDYKMASLRARSFYTSYFLEKLGDNDPADLFTHSQPWPDVSVEITRLICQTYLLENGVAQGDRLSMASSVELRLPFLDHRLVETVIGLRKFRTDYKLPPKAWLKAAIGDLIPDWVMNRPKQGFAPPVRQWYAALFAAYGDQLIDGHLVQAGVLTPQAARLLAAGPIPPGSIMPLSFKALVLENWCRSLSQNTSFSPISAAING
jgi:asparagine synthase (glutamine-hydrolysing)